MALYSDEKGFRELAYWGIANSTDGYQNAQRIAGEAPWKTLSNLTLGRVHQVSLQPARQGGYIPITQLLQGVRRNRGTMADGAQADDGRGRVGHCAGNPACQLAAADVYRAGYAAGLKLFFFAHVNENGP